MMKPQAITLRQIDDAAHILRSGGVVALPTETVYGLAARADNADAVEKIFAAKNRPAINPLICHVSSIEMAKTLVEFDMLAIKLVEKFWPGALTLVLPKKNGTVDQAVSAGLETLAVRMPAHEGMLSIIEAVGAPLAAPSANRSGRMSPTLASHVARDMEDKIDMIIDGGPTKFGLESTVIAVRDGDVTILRHGAIALEDIEAVLGFKVSEVTTAKTPQSPGQLLRHYAPKTKLVLHSQKGEVQLGFGTGGTRDLSPSRNLQEAASNLFSMLEELDQMGAKEIHIATIPHEGVGVAINDRLKRAATSVAKS